MTMMTNQNQPIEPISRIPMYVEAVMKIVLILGIIALAVISFTDIPSTISPIERETIRITFIIIMAVFVSPFVLFMR